MSAMTIKKQLVAVLLAAGDIPLAVMVGFETATQSGSAFRPRRFR